MSEVLVSHGGIACPGRIFSDVSSHRPHCTGISECSRHSEFFIGLWSSRLTQSRRCLLQECVCVRETGHLISTQISQTVILDFNRTRSRSFDRQGQVWELETVFVSAVRHLCVSICLSTLQHLLSNHPECFLYFKLFIFCSFCDSVLVFN